MFEKMFTNVNYLQKGLDASALRTQVIQNNIANAETPGFKASSVDFETMFYDALTKADGLQTKTTRDKHIDFSGANLDEVNPVIRERYNTTHRMDENNVDIDYENAKLAENQIYYNLLVEKINGDLGRLRMAIRETT